MAASNEEDDDIISKEITHQIEDLSINNDKTAVCANCGKEGIHLNKCNKCKAAVYCNAACKKKHRSKHKEDCERRVAELHEDKLERERRAVELHEEALFNQPPPKEDCPICMLLLPPLSTGYTYSSCCGKIICSGCIYAVAIRDMTEQKCAFCRTPPPDTDKEALNQAKKLVEVNDANAIHSLGVCYSIGEFGLPQNHAKALELYHRAADLGNAMSYFNIGNLYYNGEGVEQNEEKAIHYWDLAAMGGHVNARHNLGVLEWRAGRQTGNIDRALKHFMIAAGCGYTGSLEHIKHAFMNGVATKDDYVKALRVYQANLVEIKSPQRDEAAAMDDDNKYY